MTQHEYIFVAISIILGLAITRQLHTIASLIRVHTKVTVHWSTGVWAFCVMTYILQLWWVGWDLRGLSAWEFTDFAVLTVGSICIYGAAEMALPVPEEDLELDFLQHSQTLGRLSALSMLLYFCMGPYVNIAIFGNATLPSLVVPAIGILMMGLIIALPRFFSFFSLLFLAYTLLILIATA